VKCVSVEWKWKTVASYQIRKTTKTAFHVTFHVRLHLTFWYHQSKWQRYRYAEKNTDCHMSQFDSSDATLPKTLFIHTPHYMCPHRFTQPA